MSFTVQSIMMDFYMCMLFHWDMGGWVIEDFEELVFSFHNFFLEESEILMILILKLIKTVWTAEA